MIDLYSNENFPIEMVNHLRELGYDVLTSYEAGQANQGIPDDAVLAYATQQNRAIITLNREDFIQLHRSGKTHCGMIICKDDRDYKSQIKFLNQTIGSLDFLTNRLIRVKKQNQQKSDQPIFVVREYTR